MLNYFKYLIPILFIKLYAENHKVLSFLNSYNPGIISFFEPCVNENLIVHNKDGKIQYSEDKPKISFKNGDKDLQKPDQSFLVIKLDHSFDEFADNIYYGFSLAYMDAYFTGYTTNKKQCGFFRTSGIGIGAYAQWQDEEETDYNFFAKISLLGLAQSCACIVLNTKIYSHTPLTYKEVWTPLTLGVLGILQAGIKIGSLEISGFISYNTTSRITFKLNTYNSQQQSCQLLTFGISLGFLFK